MRQQLLINELRSLTVQTSQENRDKGFYEDDDFMANVALNLVPANMREQFMRIWNMNRKLARIALIHTELSEAVEAIRKGKMDDHLPHLSGESVEIGDALVRIDDYAGAYGIDVHQARFEKQEYNKSRPYKHGKQI